MSSEHSSYLVYLLTRAAPALIFMLIWRWNCNCRICAEQSVGVFTCRKIRADPNIVYEQPLYAKEKRVHEVASITTMIEISWEYSMPLLGEHQ